MTAMTTPVPSTVLPVTRGPSQAAGRVRLPARKGGDGENGKGHARLLARQLTFGATPHGGAGAVGRVPAVKGLADPVPAGPVAPWRRPASPPTGQRRDRTARPVSRRPAVAACSGLAA